MNKTLGKFVLEYYETESGTHRVDMDMDADTVEIGLDTFQISLANYIADNVDKECWDELVEQFAERLRDSVDVVKDEETRDLFNSWWINDDLTNE